MQEIAQKDLENIIGGGLSFWGIFSVITAFVVGIIDGIARPIKCG